MHSKGIWRTIKQRKECLHHVTVIAITLAVINKRELSSCTEMKLKLVKVDADHDIKIQTLFTKIFFIKFLMVFNNI